MRILLLSHVRRDPAGGAASSTLALTEEWRLLGHTVDDFYFDDLPQVRAGRLTPDLAAAVAVPFILQRLRGVDVLIITGSLGWLTFTILRKRHDRPALVSLTYGLEHEDWEEVQREARSGRASVSRLAQLRYASLVRPAVEKSIISSDLFVAPRARDVRRAVDHGWKKASEAYVSEWGVDRNAAAYWRAPRSDWRGRVLWCGTTVDRKGWAYFRDGFIAANETDPTLTLDLVGTRQNLEYFRQQFPGSTHLTVWPVMTKSDQFQLMASADVFVSTSLSEGYHLALQEALALGLPCIATREGFIAETDAPSHLVVEIRKRSSDDVANAIHLVASSPELRVSLSKRAAIWTNAHSWSTVAVGIIQRIGSIVHPSC